MEMNTVYNLDDEVIGIFRFGVAWSKNPRVRLGEYDDDFVYSNDGNVLAKIGDNTVMDIIGETIGQFDNYDLLISGKTVGKCIGNIGARAAAIVFLFSNNAAHNKSLKSDAASGAA